jgi:hypothetical protein
MSADQVSRADALAALLRELPDVPELRDTALTSWTLTARTPGLHASVGSRAHDPFGVLRRAADRLGGSIRPAGYYGDGGLLFRRHSLHTSWRDLPVVVQVGVRVTAPQEVA